MKKINLTNAQIDKCIKIIKDKILEAKIEIYHCDMYIEDASQYQLSELAKKQEEAMSKWKKEKEELENLLSKFN